MKKLFALFFLLMPTLLFAHKKQGQQLVDSLLKVLPTLPADTFRVKVLYEISSGYWTFNATEGIKYRQQALEMSNQPEWQKGVAMAYGVIDRKKKYLQHIRVQENVLKNIAQVQSHDLRGPVATILGLAKLYNQENPNDPNNKTVISDIIDVSAKLDKLIINLIKKENKLVNDGKDIEKDNNT